MNFDFKGTIKEALDFVDNMRSLAKEPLSPKVKMFLGMNINKFKIYEEGRDLFREEVHGLEGYKDYQGDLQKLSFEYADGNGNVKGVKNILEFQKKKAEIDTKYSGILDTIKGHEKSLTEDLKKPVVVTDLFKIKIDDLGSDNMKFDLTPLVEMFEV